MLSYLLAAAALLIALRAIGRRPFAVFARRVTGSLPLRPLGSERGAERWLAIGGVASVVGMFVGSLVAKGIGYPIACVGLLLVAYAGIHVALDRNGAARAFVRRFWVEQGFTVLAPLIQMRIIGAGMAGIGLMGVVVVLAATFR